MIGRITRRNNTPTNISYHNKHIYEKIFQSSRLNILKLQRTSLYEAFTMLTNCENTTNHPRRDKEERRDNHWKFNFQIIINNGSKSNLMNKTTHKCV